MYTNQKGFTYIEVMIAIVILMVGMLAMLSALTANLIRSYESEKRIAAKQIALSTIESIIAAKDIQRPGAVSGWETIQNSTPSPDDPGIFSQGFNPVREQNGWDGVAGTIDDACQNEGPCVVTGRPNNTSPVVSGVLRQIVISDVNDSERPTPPNPIANRRIDITIRFFVGSVIRDEVMSTVVSNY